MSAPGKKWTRWFIGVAIFLIAFIVLGLLAVGFRIGKAARPPIPEWSDGAPSALEFLLRKRCAEFIARGESLGLVVAVVRDDEVCLRGFGRSALFFGKQVTGDTVFEIGSITKTFTGALLASEIRGGRLSLETPIQELIPSDVELPPEARRITLKNLTTHTSGFPRLPEDERAMLPGALGMLVFGSDPYAGFDESRYLKALRHLKLESALGEQMRYSNFGMTIMGYLLARRTGRDYEELVKAEICLPLKMADTAVNLTKAQEARFTKGYRGLFRLGPLEVGFVSQPWLDYRNLEGAGGLRSTGRDMLKYLLANMRPGDDSLGLSLRDSHQRLFTRKKTGVGMNWMLSEVKGLESPVIWHNGGTGGFRSFLGFTQDGRYGVLVLSNSAASVDDLAGELLFDIAK